MSLLSRMLISIVLAAPYASPNTMTINGMDGASLPSQKTAMSVTICKHAIVNPLTKPRVQDSRANSSTHAVHSCTMSLVFLALRSS